MTRCAARRCSWPVRQAVRSAGQHGSRQPGDQGAAGPLRLQRRLGAGGLRPAHPVRSQQLHRESRVVSPGQQGVKQISYRLVYLDGKLASRVWWVPSSSPPRSITSPGSAPGSSRGRAACSGRQPPAPRPGRARAAAVEQWAQLGRGRGVRVRWQLAHQHRQRLLRRPAVRLGHLAVQRRRGLRLARRPGHSGAADRGRDQAVQRPGRQPMACLRTAPLNIPFPRRATL